MNNKHFYLYLLVVSISLGFFQDEARAQTTHYLDKEKIIQHWISEIEKIHGDQGLLENDIFLYERSVTPRFLPTSSWKQYLERLKVRAMQPPYASNELRRIGLPALPALVNAFKDKTLTLAVWDPDCNHGIKPKERVTVGQAAKGIFKIICYDHGLTPPDFIYFHPDLSAKVSFTKFKKQFDQWYEEIPPDTQRLSAEKREEFRSELLDLFLGYRIDGCEAEVWW
ncbi:MAG: hypothetical protein KAR32_05755 [Candidatus Omnitrophica bacterium]|nr:hypothetical protein [Candidatus Omnitrophota bacterium]